VEKLASFARQDGLTFKQRSNSSSCKFQFRRAFFPQNAKVQLAFFCDPASSLGLRLIQSCAAHHRNSGFRDRRRTLRLFAAIATGYGTSCAPAVGERNLMNAKTDSRQNHPANAEEENTSSPFPREQVAAVAYQLYEQHGRRDGHDREDWFQAEQQLKESTRRSGAMANARDGEIAKSVLEATSPARARAKTERASATNSSTRGMAKDSSPRHITGGAETRGPQAPPAVRQSARTR
jgi:hypothetical protein